MAPIRQHGEKGVFVGGDWVNIEDCDKKFNIKGGSGECTKNCETCPRSKSRHTSAKKDGSYDVIIIGGGCVGCSIARELSKTTSSVLILEAADDVAQGATKGSSGIVHAGFDDKPGTNRAKFCWPGNQMFPKLDEELHFGFQRNGSLVIARGHEEEEVLQDLMKRGATNGVKNLRILNRQEVLDLEPYVADDVTAALYSPDAGNMIPYEYAIALAENAVDNGVELRIRRKVTQIEKTTDGYFNITVEYWEPKTYLDAMERQHQESKAKSRVITNILFSILFGFGLSTAFTHVLFPENIAMEKYGHLLEKLPGDRPYIHIIFPLLAILLTLINYIISLPKKVEPITVPPPSVGTGGTPIGIEEMKFGGSGSCAVMNGQIVATETFRTKYIVNAAGNYSDKIANMIGDNSFTIQPRIGNYLLLHRNQGYLATHTLFPCPHPKLGKGVLVQSTLWGNLILGPTARDTYLPEVMAETNEDIMTYILTKCRQLVPSFDAKQVFHSFWGSRAKNTRGDWIIEPSQMDPHFIHAAGIDSPGLAGSPAIAVEIVRLLGEAGLKMERNPKFNPIRAPIIRPKNSWKGIKAGPIGKYTDPNENVICKCEKVTEAEVIEAIHRSLPIDSTQAIRKRTRAGMGDCQGRADNYDCECRVAQIIARETKLPLDAVGRRPWPATSTFTKRWLEEEDKLAIEKLSK